jgi:tRNA threonylcarbamoyladenosine biosynthesis protein TsaE
VEKVIHLADESATIAIGEKLGAILAGRAVVYLDGQLGAGKTTLCRGIMRAFGHSGAVKSPTYTLVEPYEFENVMLFHFDLYRLGDAEELEFMGIRDYFQQESVCLIEWPGRGEGAIPRADIVLSLAVEGEGRRLTATSRSARGVDLLSLLS